MTSFKHYKSDFLIIIVNWNTKEMLSRCLSSLRSIHEQLNFEVLIIDNGSSDGSPDMLKKDFSQYHLVFNKENLGFGKANNLGFKKFPNFPYYLLLNSDTVVNLEAIKEMLDVMRGNPKIAAINPALRLPSGGFQQGGAGFGPSWITSFNTFFALTRISRLFKGIFIRQEKYREQDHPIFVTWLAMACTLFRNEAVNDVGLFDERYFVYGEDSDWCWRAKKRNWEMAFLPYVYITHFLGGSSEFKSYKNPSWFMALADSVRRQGGILDYYSFLCFCLLGHLFRYWILACWDRVPGTKSYADKRELSLLLIKASYKLILRLK